MYLEDPRWVLDVGKPVAMGAAKWKNMVVWKCVRDNIEVNAVGISRCLDSRLEMDKTWKMES